MVRNKGKIGDEILRRRRAAVEADQDITEVWRQQTEKEARKEQLHIEYLKNREHAKKLKSELASHYFEPSQWRETASEFASKAVEYVKETLLRFSKKQIRIGLGAVLGVMLLLVVVTSLGGGSEGTSDDSSEVLGNSTTSDIDVQTTPELTKEQPVFDLLFPEGTDGDSYDIARVSPDGAAPAYTYLDRFSDEGAIFRVSQQEVPADFNLGATATEFQATNKIQVDDNVIFHGYSERGRTQSLLFLKDNLLISIRSPEKFADETWATYFLSLN